MTSKAIDRPEKTNKTMRMGYLQIKRKQNNLTEDELFELGMIYFREQNHGKALLIFIELLNRVNDKWQHHQELIDIIDEIYRKPKAC